MQNLSKIYNPKEVESRIYNLWQESGFFNPDKLPGRRKKTFAISLPPPNITGELHIGHALNALIQDILVRQKRMEGFRTLWLPGVDHAGIATQNVVERELKKEGLTRFDLGREKFIEKVWAWREKYGNIILEQFKKIGCSLDWSRTRFTMDEGYAEAVKFAFLHYYKKGWIYRGEKVVNWCPRCRTSLSDLELEHKEEKGKLWYLKYPLQAKSENSTVHTQRKAKNYIVVATTRPETMLGDTAVAVNPKDKRYKNLIGKKAILPIHNREIPIIADSAVDPEFGTGAVKVTPAHDQTDWEIKERHNLKVLRVIDENGIGKKESQICEGLGVFECRKKVIETLEKETLIEKVEDYSYSLPYCYRCHTLVEPLLSPQWFLRMTKLAKKALAAVQQGKIKFHPKKWEKIYFHWLNNIKDWCISRQIWWGHKIPLQNETDVLDTWFSSALWPFAALGWPIACAQNQKSLDAKRTPRRVAIKNQKYCKPKKNSDLANFYPTDVLSTARDIINLWVTRMIFSGLEFTKKIPFKTVFIHPTVLTKEGKRMSKSLGTGIDPLLLIEKYGADATRFGIAWQIMDAQDIRFLEENIVMGKKFCNKIWNAARFVLMNKPTRIYADLEHGLTRMKNLTSSDKKILKALDKTIKSVNKDLESFRFGSAARCLYDFFWHDFCDIYIENAKKQMAMAGSTAENTKRILLFTLVNSLKLLHPFIPFITEEIYQKLPNELPHPRRGGVSPSGQVLSAAFIPAAGAAGYSRRRKKKKCLMVEEWPSAS